MGKKRETDRTERREIIKERYTVVQLQLLARVAYVAS